MDFYRHTASDMIISYTIILICSVHIIFCNAASPFGISPRQDLPFEKLAEYDGYTAEKHYVTTKDGYILGVFRIPVQKNCKASRGVILFMHGLYLSGDDCIIPGPGKAHCYIYSDNCYDIWVPNARGNFYSRNHTSYNPNRDSAFWNFSLDELAIYDLPAVIDYVLLKTKESQLSYIGHSRAVAMLLILCSKMPDYNAKIKVGFGISPSAWMYDTKLIVMKLESLLAGLTLSDEILSVEILSRNGLLQSAGEFVCGTSELSYPVCSAFVFALMGYNKFQITRDVLPVVVGHTPAGTSLKSFVRWGQLHMNGFSEYDHGSVKNVLVYGRTNPPLYDLSNISMPWVLLGSENDFVSNVTDIKILVSKLQNASLCVLSDKTFGHLDFVYGKDIPNFLTPVVLSYLEAGTYTCP